MWSPKKPAFISKNEKIFIYFILILTTLCSIVNLVLLAILMADGVKIKNSMLTALKLENMQSYIQQVIPAELLAYIFQQSLKDPDFVSALAQEINSLMNT
jgi:hypothetical protein